MELKKIKLSNPGRQDELLKNELELENNLSDFYYSETEAKNKNYRCNQVRGQLYTQATPAGEKPIGQYKDYILVAANVDLFGEEVKVNEEVARQGAAEMWAWQKLTGGLEVI